MLTGNSFGKPRLPRGSFFTSGRFVEKKVDPPISAGARRRSVRSVSCMVIVFFIIVLHCGDALTSPGHRNITDAAQAAKR